MKDQPATSYFCSSSHEGNQERDVKPLLGEEGKDKAMVISGNRAVSSWRGSRGKKSKKSIINGGAALDQGSKNPNCMLLSPYAKKAMARRSRAPKDHV